MSSVIAPALCLLLLPTVQQARVSVNPSSRMTDLPTTPENSSAANPYAELFRAVADGERYPLGRLYDEFSRPLYGLAYRLLQDRAEAEDVVHDVFLSLRQRGRDFDSAKGSALTWLATLTKNRALDRLRTRLRRQEIVAQAAPSDFGWEPLPVAMPAAAVEGEAPPVAAVSAEPDPAAATEGRERADVVRAAITALPAEQRQALELAYFTGLTQQEVAEKLQEPLGTIKARIRRGLLQLREIVGKRL